MKKIIIASLIIIPGGIIAFAMIKMLLRKKKSLDYEKKLEYFSNNPNTLPLPPWMRFTNSDNYKIASVEEKQLKDLDEKPLCNNLCS